jgi:hypothetical protein
VENPIILGWKGLPETKKTSLLGSRVNYGHHDTQHNVKKCDTQLNGIQYCHNTVTLSDILQSVNYGECRGAKFRLYCITLTRGAVFNYS